jgi:predicted helicase
VRFLRLAERRIAEMTGRGVVCYISSYSYLSDPSFVVVRKRFCGEFDYAWIDCLNGDSRETGKLTPDGQPDPSVFSTEYNREGIRLGTSVGLFAKTGAADSDAVVRYREFWGADKRALLLKTLEQEENFDAQYETVAPVADNRFSFRPSKTEANYSEWPAIVELAEEEPISGLQEMRRGALMAHERESLQERMQRYFDKSVDWAAFAADGNALSRNAGRFDPVSTRARLQGSEAYDDGRLKRYALYPFDNRWCYYSSVRPLWNEPRPELVSQRADAAPFLIVRRFAERPKEGSPAFFTSALPDYHLLRPNAVAIPLRLSSAPAEVSEQSTGQGSIFEHLHDSKHTSANLSNPARSYLAALTNAKPDQDEEMSRAVWFHALAILYAPQYLSEHSASVRADWPRIPLPTSLSALQHSAKLGASLAQLLDVEKPVLGVTSGKLRKELSTLGRITGPKGLSLEISAGWGHIQKEKDIVMPGRGLERERDFSADEKTAIKEGAIELGISVDDALTLWGEKTLDIYLNNETHWSNVPLAVWDYTIGGYQVLKK